MDAILDEITLYQRRNKLDEMTKGGGLGDAYAATLSRMKAQPRNRSKLGMEALMWVAHAERPLHVDELCHVLGVEEGSMDLNIRNIPAIETLLACTLGLVTVEKSSSTVRLVHYTLQEYLSHNPNLFLNPHSAIAEICLTYLNFPHIRSFSPTLRSVPPTAPFVEYAACYWGTHARRGITESAKNLALKLLDGFDKHISSKILLMHGVSPWDWPFDPEDTPRGFTGLHSAAYHGCVEIVVALLETDKWDVQATDFNGNTAISWAARRGHEGVVRVLLELSDVNLHKADKWCRTPLLLAAENGHEGVMRILLERSDASPDTMDDWSRTPLLLAAGSGHEGAVRILLERNDANPNAMDDWSRTPLLLAAENGHEGVVRILLERNDVNPNTAAKCSRTPLLLAAENGHEGVVKILLLECNHVNPNIADAWNRTPLLLATRNEHEGVVRMLLQRNDVNPDTADRFGQTPLLLATKNGHEEVVRMLLGRNNVNPNTADDRNQFPLYYAASGGHRGIVRMLLERKDINPGTAFIDYLESLTDGYPESPELDDSDPCQGGSDPLPCGRNSWLRSVGSRLTGDFSGPHHNLFYYRGSNLRGHSRFHHGNSEQY